MKVFWSKLTVNNTNVMLVLHNTHIITTGVTNTNHKFFIMYALVFYETDKDYRNYLDIFKINYLTIPLGIFLKKIILFLKNVEG